MTNLYSIENHKHKKNYRHAIETIDILSDLVEDLNTPRITHDMKNIIEEMGIKVMYTPDIDSDLLGYAEFRDGEPVIILNVHKSEKWRRYAMTYGLCTIALRWKWFIPNRLHDDDKSELFAYIQTKPSNEMVHLYTIEVLVPSDAVVQIIIDKDYANLETLDKIKIEKSIAKIYNVNEITAREQFENYMFANQ